jgi:hypothetical protein
MTKVFVVSKYNNDISGAEKFGEVVELTTGAINPFALDRLAWTISGPLQDFSEDDYFLLTGPGSGYIIGGILLFSRFNKIKCLRYDASIQSYVPIEVSMDDVPILEAEPAPVGRIFILNFSGHSIISALRFSNLPDEKLVAVTVGNIDQADTKGLIQGMSEKLKSFQTGDMLILSGPAVLHIIAAAILYKMRKDVGVLLFNPKFQRYDKRVVEMDHMRFLATTNIESVA